MASTLKKKYMIHDKSLSFQTFLKHLIRINASGNIHAYYGVTYNFLTKCCLRSGLTWSCQGWVGWLTILHKNEQKKQPIIHLVSLHSTTEVQYSRWYRERIGSLSLHPGRTTHRVTHRTSRVPSRSHATGLLTHTIHYERGRGKERENNYCELCKFTKVRACILNTSSS